MVKAKAVIGAVVVVAVISAFYVAVSNRKDTRSESMPARQDDHAETGTPTFLGGAGGRRGETAETDHVFASGPVRRAASDATFTMADSADPTRNPSSPERSRIEPAEFAATLEEADRLAGASQVMAAHRILSTLYRGSELNDAQKAAVLSRLEPVARAAFFSSGEPAPEPPYVVQSGDLLIRIARRWGVSWQYLERLNGIDARRLRAGQRLKVVRGPFEAVVDLSEFELTVYLNGWWVRNYRVGTGRNDKTPVGTFKVLDKVENPKYDGPEGHFAPDDPQNPVGEHWIALGDGYGIHGTVEPQSIGKQESLGCIRMLPEDVEEVYHLLVRGSQVTIQR
jgi:LysM repeat protein